MSLLRGPDYYLDEASERLERFQYSPGPVFRNGP
jgi:hypothetical protein